jgi:hypothetical protein
VMFLALAGIEAALPDVLERTRDRFGRSAAVAAITAVSIVAISYVALQFVAHTFPWSASIGISVPDFLATPLPALTEPAQALFGAIVIACAAGLYSTALPQKHLGIVTVIAVFCAMVDPRSTPQQMPVMLATALALAVVIWLIARYVLGPNPLAWPLAIFTGATLNAASVLLANHRTDLLINGIAMLLLVVAALAWAWRGRDAGVV